MSFCFVFINYNNADFTRSAIISILNSDAKKYPIVIVDNSSRPEEIFFLKIIESEYNTVKVIYSSENIGYFPGINIGLKYISQNYKNVKYIIVGNNDLLFPENFVASVLDCSQDFKKYPVISPNITMLDGAPQNPHVVSEISKFREFIYDLYHANYLLACLIVKVAELTKRFTDRKDEQQHEIAQEIYQGYGACYILGPKFFELFEELWAPTFLMYEEFFLSKQLESKGFKIFYEPQIKVQHCCHASTDLLPGKVKWEFSRKAHKEYRKFVKSWR